MPPLGLEKIEKERRERGNRLQSSLQSILPQLESMGALKVMVFGSFAGGKINSQSDLDILVIMPQERSGREWSRLIYGELERDVAMDILVFNTIELEKELPRNVLLREILEKGRLVLEKIS